jgi:hypothetical protein
VLAAGLALPALTAAPATAATTLGINAGAFRPGSSAELRRASADVMAAHDLELVRMDILWNDVQPLPFKPVNFSSYDPVVADLAARGIRLAPVLAYSAKWASSLAPPLPVPTLLAAPPANVEDYANYAGRLAARYGRGGSFWRENPSLPYLPITTYEIWNEENSVAYWHPAPNPSGYAKLLRAAATRIRAVDSSATVMVGGLVARDNKPGTIAAPAFLAAVVAADPKITELIGAVGLHSYASTASGTVANVPPLRSMMTKLGLNVPIAVNEWGAPSGGPGGLSETQRAKLVRDTARALGNNDCNLSYVAPYTWHTSGQDTERRADWFGLVHYEGLRVVPTASGTAYLAAAESKQTPPKQSVCKQSRSARKSKRGLPRLPRLPAGLVHR